MAPLAGRLADRFPAGILAALGLTMFGTGFLLLAFLPSSPSTLDIVWRIGVCGSGMGLFQQPNSRSIIMSAPLERSGSAGAIQGTARLLGQSIGAAFVALVFGFVGGSQGARTAILCAVGFAAIGIVTSLSRMLDGVRVTRALRRTTRLSKVCGGSPEVGCGGDQGGVKVVDHRPFPRRRLSAGQLTIGWATSAQSGQYCVLEAACPSSR
jgi:MFS family permease